MSDLYKSLQNVFAKWEDKSQPGMQPLTYAGPPKHNDIIPAYGRGSRRRNGLNATQSNFGRSWRGADSVVPSIRNILPNLHVADFKEVPIVYPQMVGKRPYMGTCCCKCLPLSKELLVDEVTRNLGFNNILYVNTMNKDKNFVVRKFCYIFHALRTKIVGNPDIMKMILNDERVMQAIENTVDKGIKNNVVPVDAYNAEIKKELHLVYKLIRKMSANIVSGVVKLCIWILLRILARVCVSLQVNKGQMEVLKKASDSKFPLIFLPLHRSHLDSILISFILLSYGVDIPLVAAGDNLNIPLIGTLLQWHGGFYIKRKWDSVNGDKDYIYRAVLNSYLENCLKRNKNLEYYVEGGRTRTGRTLLPKAGLMSMVMSIYLSGTVPDAYIVPVSINYDRLLDGNFISEELGHSKTSESTWATFKALWGIFRSSYGMIRADFGQPFSLREFVERETAEYPRKNPFLNIANLPTSGFASFPTCTMGGDEETTSTRALSPACLSGMVTPETYADKDLHRHVVSRLLKHAVYDATQCTAIMSTNMIAFLLLTKLRKGTSLANLASTMEWLRNELFARKRDVGFSGSMIDVANYALAFWGQGFIKLERANPGESSTIHNETAEEQQDVIVKPVVTLPHVLELSYYSNYVTSVFLLESVIANCVYSLLNVDFDALVECESSINISLQKLLDKGIFLCDVLKFDFLFAPPCTDLRVAISEIIDKFRDAEILSTPYLNLNNNNSQDEHYRRPSRRPLHDEFESDDENDVQDENLVVNLSKQSVEQLNFLRNVLSPVLESYFLVASCLNILIGQHLKECEFLTEIRSYIYSQIADGLVLHEESISTNTLQHAIKLFEDWKVVQVYTKDKIRFISLTEKYSDDKQLGEILNSVRQFNK